ncbi:uncharacterized protein YwqG [Variovorax boronicumulans]|uniref:DUF1963 domain-containing protein n=1 Tax=Variovorax boronicumulans TaxID=436515 RepID=UPI00278B2A99|nr:DUF1963 domain-containing protein [Variovorax boronicumulans]MDQ0085990.1 uncharacterized protein YwqG [Variovorax boronicumulans]
MQEDIFQVGDAHFAFTAQSSASFVDGGMQFQLHTAPVAFDAALHAPAFQPDDVDNPSLGTIAPQFGTYGAFFFHDKTGEPLRIVQMPQNQPATFDFHLYERGFALDSFHGTVTLTPSSVELRGTMRSRYDDSKSVPIHVRKAFEPGEVTLQPHTYTSLAEAAEVPPERVRRLLIRQPWQGDTPKIEAFPPEILRFRNLEFLSLQFMSPAHAPFTALPDEFCSLASLKELFVRGSAIEHLPENFGALEQLEALFLQYGKLRDLPDSIGRLSRLQRLVLPGNALATLPECVGHLPALTLLNVEKNPFVSLPASLKKIKKVTLENKLKALYLDIRYRPDVDVAVAPESFLARGSAEHAAILEAACARHKLKRYLPALLRLARNTVRYRTTEPEDYAQKGNTRFGGAPDLPPDIEFPRAEDGTHWRFYAQLRLADVAGLQPWLPRDGMLYFFGEDQDELHKHRVIHSTAPASSLQTYVYPDDATFENGDAFPGFKAVATATVSVPSLYNARDRLTGRDAVLLNIEDDDKLQKTYWALQEELSGKSEDCHLVNAHVFTQHESPEEQASAERGGLPGEWINLLMLESDNRPGFCFWDAGTLSFSIHMKDLALGDFSRTFASLESS